MAQPDAFQMNTAYTTNNASLSTSGLVDTTDLDLHRTLLSDPTSQSPPLGLVNPLGSVCRIVDTAPGYITPMHRTMSVDYGVVIVGEMELQLDGGEKRILKAGDVVVQRGTMHAWRNPDDKAWSRMMFVMLGLGEGGAVNVGGRRLMEEFVEEAGDHSGGGAASSNKKTDD